MRYRVYIACFLITALFVPSFAFAAVPVARVPVDQLPPIRVVEETQDDVLALGCIPITMPDGAQYVSISSAQPYPVFPKDGTPNELLFCSQSVAAQLTTRGQVAGVMDLVSLNNEADALVLKYGEVNNKDSMGIFEWLGNQVSPFGLGTGTVNIVSTGGQAAVAAAKYVGEPLIKGTVYYLSYFAVQIGVWLLQQLSFYTQILLTASKFYNHPFVKGGWPFVQGVANLGFILALLFIAFATTLRLEIGGGGVKKLLPRLLFAALLINFSLVIGGMLIDISRLLMAIIASAITDTKIEDLSVAILKQSRIFTTAFIINTDTPGEIDLKIKGVDWLTVLQAAILVWGLVVGFFTLTVGLFMRYIMLILLLIASPFAYLAIALPMTGSIAKKWWVEFLKYVFYGPAALFILVLLVRVTENMDSAELMGQRVGIRFESILAIGLTIAMLIIAATVGKRMGVIGAAATVSFATSQGKRVASGARRSGMWTGKKAAQGVGVATRPATRPVRDFSRTLKSDVVAQARGGELFGKGTNLSKAARFAAGVPRDGKGAPRQGYTSVGMTGARLIGPKSSGVKAMMAAGTDLGADAYKPLNLRAPDVGRVMTKEQRGAVLNSHSIDNRQQRVELVGNAEAVRNMKGDEHDTIIKLETNLSTDTGDRDADHLSKQVNEAHKAMQTAYRKSLDKLDKEGDIKTT